MHSETMYASAYKGTKEFSQWNVQTANATGFGAAADDYSERGIDLNEVLIQNKPATYFFRMNGDAMLGAGIHSGDVLIADRSIKKAHGKIIIATLNGEMLVRRYFQEANSTRLVPEHPKMATVQLDAYAEFSIWGVVTYVIHAV